jgi:hypothetical protein
LFGDDLDFRQLHPGAAHAGHAIGYPLTAAVGNEYGALLQWLSRAIAVATHTEAA